MKKIGLVGLSAFLLFWLTGICQNQTTKPVINKLVFAQKRSTQTVYLPGELRAGTQVMGTLKTDVSNVHPPLLSINNVSVPLEADGRFQFHIPVNATTISLALGEDKTAKNSQQQISVAPLFPGVLSGNITIDHSLYLVDEFIKLQIPESLGPVQAFLERSSQKYPLNLLSASENNRIFEGIKAIPPGNYNFRVIGQGGNSLYSASINIVEFSGNVGKANLKKGQSTQFDFSMKGLGDYCCLPVQLVIKNLSVNTVGFDGSPELIVNFDSNEVQATSGFVQIKRTASALRTGDFEIQASVVRNDDPPIIFAKDEPLPKPRPQKDEAILSGLDMAIKKVIADAGGAKGKEWDELCENCQKCIKSRTGEWAVRLVEKLGEDIIKEFAGKAVDLILDAAKSMEKLADMVEGISDAKEEYDKAKEKAEKLEEMKEKVEDAIRKGELKVIELEPKMCGKCLISGIIFYSPLTGCVTAILYCKGNKDCCPQADNRVVLHYCTDDRGQPADKAGPITIEIIKR